METWKQTKIKNYILRELQVPIYINGELVYNDPSLLEKQKYCEQEYNSMYPEVTRINKPHEYYVDLSDTLRELKNKLIEIHTKKEEN